MLQPGGCDAAWHHEGPSRSGSATPEAGLLSHATPLVELIKINPHRARGVRVFLKCEFVNPTGSIKDRMAAHCVDAAERSGKLRPGMTLVTASSGNTACALAYVAQQKGYGCVVVTNTKCSREKQEAPKKYGAEVIVTRSGVPPDSPDHYMNVATAMCESAPEEFFDLNQYDNPDNPDTYFSTMGPEIWAQMDGDLDYFVAAGSTGGTLSGNGRFLKQASGGRVKVVLADPLGSVWTPYFKTGELPTSKQPGYLVEGVGKDSIPGALDCSVVDSVIGEIPDTESFRMCYQLHELEGLHVGGSAGLNVAAALRLAAALEGPATIVTVAPDGGAKYLSKIYDRAWLREHDILYVAGDT